MIPRFYQLLSALCFVVAILSIAQQASAADKNPCKRVFKNGAYECDNDCTAPKPRCILGVHETSGVTVCVGCQA